jgi:hypothetical protein
MILMVELLHPDGLFYLQPALTAVNLDILDQGVRAVVILLERFAETDLAVKVLTTSTT